jgi:hypothetical protein
VKVKVKVKVKVRVKVLVLQVTVLEQELLCLGSMVSAQEQTQEEPFELRFPARPVRPKRDSDRCPDQVPEQAKHASPPLAPKKKRAKTKGKQ